MRDVVQIVIGTARDPAVEENIQHTQDTVDPMEVNWQPFAPR